MSAIAVLEARAEQAESIKSFIAGVVRASLKMTDWLREETLKNVNDNVDLWLREPSRCVHLVAMQEGKLLGVVLVKDFWNLCSLFVSTERQRGGIGRLLLESAASRCLGRSPESGLFLNAAAEAVGFYERLGFVHRTTTQTLPEGYKAMQRSL